MPMPWAYRHATKEFRAVLDDVKSRAGLASDNTAYTAIDAVFQVYRRRLTPSQGIAFASVLPAVLSAIFVHDWDVEQPVAAMKDLPEMNREAQSIRVDHNQTPDDAFETVAWVLWRHVNHHEMKRMLASLPPDLAEVWTVPVTDPSDIVRQMF